MTTTEARTSRCVRGHEVAHDSEVCSTCGAPIELQPHVRKAMPISEILKRSDEYYALKPPPPVEAVTIEPSDTTDPAAESVDAPVPEVEAEWPASAPKAEPDVGNAKPIAEILKRSPPVEAEAATEMDASERRPVDPIPPRSPNPARRGLVPRKPPAERKVAVTRPVAEVRPAPARRVPRKPTAAAKPEATEPAEPPSRPAVPITPPTHVQVEEFVVSTREPELPSQPPPPRPTVGAKREFVRPRVAVLAAIIVLPIVLAAFVFVNRTSQVAVSEECANSFAYASVHTDALPRTTEFCGSADEWQSAAKDYPSALAGRSLEAICASTPRAAACSTNPR